MVLTAAGLAATVRTKVEMAKKVEMNCMAPDADPLIYFALLLYCSRQSFYKFDTRIIMALQWPNRNYQIETIQPLELTSLQKIKLIHYAVHNADVFSIDCCPLRILWVYLQHKNSSNDFSIIK